MKKLTNTTSNNAIITGCGRGIGLACLRQYLEQSATGICLVLTRSETPELSELVCQYQSRVIPYLVDIQDYAAINKAIANFVSEFDFPQFVICNAGLRSRKSIPDSSLELFQDIFNVNTLGQINITKTLASLKADVNSLLHILMISSIVGPRGFSDLSTYAVSKAALDGFVKSAAVELASQNILVNSLSPGFVSSSYADSFRHNLPHLHEWTLSRTPLNRWGTCDEIAKLALQIVSKTNTFMTGSTVYCDGGWMAA